MCANKVTTLVLNREKLSEKAFLARGGGTLTVRTSCCTALRNRRGQDFRLTQAVADEKHCQVSSLGGWDYLYSSGAKCVH